ncbi:hypothetical protein EBR66_07590 [bacterium]|nr:hypothetical protein [bacterium]
MKITKDTLKKIIKEELEEMMMNPVDEVTPTTGGNPSMDKQMSVRKVQELVGELDRVIRSISYQDNMDRRQLEDLSQRLTRISQDLTNI